MSSRKPARPGEPAASPRARSSAAASAMRLDDQLCFALYSASLAMTKTYRPMLERLGLTYPQYLAMLVLWERDGSTVSELGERLRLESGTLTPLLKRLEVAGLVSRRRAVDDERQVLVHLTPAGRELRARAREIPVQMIANTGCTLEELHGLRDALHALRASLDRVNSD